MARWTTRTDHVVAIFKSGRASSQATQNWAGRGRGAAANDDDRRLREPRLAATSLYVSTRTGMDRSGMEWKQERVETDSTPRAAAPHLPVRPCRACHVERCKLVTLNKCTSNPFLFKFCTNFSKLNMINTPSVTVLHIPIPSRLSLEASGTAMLERRRPPLRLAF